MPNGEPAGTVSLTVNEQKTRLYPNLPEKTRADLDYWIDKALRAARQCDFQEAVAQLISFSERMSEAQQRDLRRKPGAIPLAQSLHDNVLRLAGSTYAESCGCRVR